MKNKTNFELHKKPWPYIVVDNFLTDEHIRTILRISRNQKVGDDELEHNYSAVKNNSVLKSNILGDDLLLELDKKYSPKILGYLRYFNRWKRLFYDYTEINLQVNGSNWSGEMHVDSPKKIVTAVIYIDSKEPYLGTELYNKNCDPESMQEINWKVNRAFIFSRTGYSHHRATGNLSSNRTVLVFNMKTEKSGIVKRIDWFKDFFVKPFV